MRVPAPRVALVGLAVALLAAGLAAVVIRAGNGGHKVASKEAATTSLPTITIAPATSTTAPAPPTTQPVPPALAAQFAQIQGQVSQIRGLPWLAPLDISVAPDAAFVAQLNYVNHRDLHPDRLQGDGVTLQLLQLFPENLVADPEWVADGKLTPKGVGELKSRLPFADLSKFVDDPAVDRIGDLYTVDMLVQYVQSKLAA